MALERSSRRIARRYHSLPVGRENHIGNSLEGVWRAILRGCTSCRMARYLSNDGSTGCQRSGTRENTNVRKSFPFYPLPVNKTQEDLIGMLLVVWLETPARPEVVGFWIPFFYMDGMIGTSATLDCQMANVIPLWRVIVKTLKSLSYELKKGYFSWTNPDRPRFTSTLDSSATAPTTGTTAAAVERTIVQQEAESKRVTCWLKYVWYLDGCRALLYLMMTNFHQIYETCDHLKQ